MSAQDDALGVMVEAVPGLQAVYRFGSTGVGTAGPESDVDLAVLAESRLEPGARFALQERLAAILREPVDLIDLKQASTVMAMQVVNSGTVLFDGDPEERTRFEGLACSRYARLNEERRGILDRIADEGSVYGR